MKVSVVSGAPERKIVAVIGSGGRGLFLPSANGHVYLSPNGRAVIYTQPFEQVTREYKESRTLVYEGDTVTLQF